MSSANALHRPIMRVRIRSRAVAPVEVVFIELGRTCAQVLQRQLDHVRPTAQDNGGGWRASRRFLSRHRRQCRSPCAASVARSYRALRRPARRRSRARRDHWAPGYEAWRPPCFLSRSDGIIAQTSAACGGVRLPRSASARLVPARRMGRAQRNPSIQRVER
jgi:hypothetical protein